jgi:molybdopterin-containing oxidoreductase family membrane subunit
MSLSNRHQRIYRAWITLLVVLILAGAWCYLRQLDMGLGLTGLSRDVTWGLYIGQFTFADGLAASAAILVLMAAVHGSRSFGKLVLYGQIIAIAAVIACMLFVVADLGQPSLLWNVLLHPSPVSIMFWDVVVLAGYLAINVLIVTVTIDCERKDVTAPRWLRPVALLSIPWAIGMQTVSAFLYCGLPGRSMWLTALLAPRFIVSACASGTALLVLVLRFARVRLESETLRKARTLIAYTMALNLFFMLLEILLRSTAGSPNRSTITMLPRHGCGSLELWLQHPLRCSPDSEETSACCPWHAHSRLPPCGSKRVSRFWPLALCHHRSVW